MPEARLESARKRGLPEGYQFGDAASDESRYLALFKKYVVPAIEHAVAASPKWRSYAENAARRLRRRAT